MRILHISALPVWPIEGKGGMPSLRETLRGHIRGGHEIFVVLPRYELFADHPRRIAVRSDDGYTPHLAPCRWAPALLGIRRIARRLGNGKEPPYALRWLLNLTLCVLLTGSLVLTVLKLRYFRGLRFDLVYAHNQYAAAAGWILARWFRVPNVTRLYGTFLADLMNRPLVQLRYPVAAAGFLIPHSLLICANDGTRGDEVARKLRVPLDRFRFWQNGVDLPAHGCQGTRPEIAARFPEIEFRCERTWILSCSRLSYWKRIDRILHALRVAVSRGHDCQLLLAGSGPEEERLRALAKELQIESHITWLGALEHDTIWELMHAADLFMITNDVTNRCNPLYEAICAGLPILSVRDHSTADLLEHEVNALLADKESTEELGEQLARICATPCLAGALRQAQSARAKELWSWQDRMAAEVRELERLVETPAPRIGVTG